MVRSNRPGPLALGQRDARGDRRMAAERDLGDRAEVADAVGAGAIRAIGRQERGLRVAHVGRDPEHLGIVRVCHADPYAGRVAAGRVERERSESKQFGHRPNGSRSGWPTVHGAQ